MIDRLRILVPTLADIMMEQKLTLCTAESCTGGGLSYWLTSIPGSSTWFDRSFVTYSNGAKMDMLGVHAATLETHGAVSKETAFEMAEGALNQSCADISIAITGIAGPDGGTDTKPVGTVWIGFARNNMMTIAQHHVFTGDRQHIRLSAMVTAVEQLILQIAPRSHHSTTD